MSLQSPDSHKNIEDLYQLVKDFLEEHPKGCKIRVPTRNGLLFLHPSEIVYIKADNNYTEIHTDKGVQEKLAMNIGKFHEMLPRKAFTRINRSIIINRQYLSRYDRATKTCTLVKNGDSWVFPVTQSLESINNTTGE